MRKSFEKGKAHILTMGTEIQLTNEQNKAVVERGKAILVSAAAGSGKTKVLTERLMKYILDGYNIDHFLVITFTRAAAAELKSRIMSRITEEAANDPENKQLRNQTALLYKAHIETIDSFCKYLVSENAAKLGISPAFTVADEERAETIKTAALEDVLEEAYKNIEQDDAFAALVNMVGSGRDDAKLAEIVLSLHDKLKSCAFPEQWLKENAEKLELDNETDIGKTIWGKWVMEDIAQEAEYGAALIDTALIQMKKDSKLLAAWSDSYNQHAEIFRAVARACRHGEWELAREQSQTVAERKKAYRGDNEFLKNQIVSAYDKKIKSIREYIQGKLCGTEKELLDQIRRSAVPMKRLCGILLDFDKEYLKRKKKEELCDYSDLEHFAVELLYDEQQQYSDLALKYSRFFTEVMVDEYQDVNQLQERLFHALSSDGKNLFVVGDIKQSIYRFRLAEPMLFNHKYEEYKDKEGTARILLQKNFRSRKEVLNAANTVFEAIMSRQAGDVEYDNDAKLVFASTEYPDEGPCAELCVVEKQTEDDSPEMKVQEANYVASRIRSMIDAGEMVTEKGLKRPIRYGDIAVLLQAPKSSSEAYRHAFAQYGIPLSSGQGGTFFEQPEIRFVLALLSIADNPRQDVPLVTALRGIPFGFEADDLAEIRVTDKKTCMWDALRKRAEENKKCSDFIELVEDLRSYSREFSTDALIRRLYDKTDLITLCNAMPDGRGHVANLMALYEYARKFESEGFRGLFRFLDRMLSLQKKQEQPALGVGPDAVSLMSIHGSKGLEFPVVFVSDLSHKFQFSQSDAVLFHQQMGLAMKITDMEKAVVWPTFAWKAVAEKIKREEISEYIRLLYVAMTRAKERLIMTCAMKEPLAEIDKLSCEQNHPVNPRLVIKSTNMAQWVLRAALGDGQKDISVKVVSATEAETKEMASKEIMPEADVNLVNKIRENINWVYPYEKAVVIPSKMTATMAKDLIYPFEEDNETLYISGKKEEFRHPRILGEGEKLTGAERGTATHRVMQHINYEKTESLALIEAEIERLVKERFIDRNQADAVVPADILAFFESELGRMVQSADRVWREFQFSVLCPVSKWFKDIEEKQKILLQGTVDLCIEKNEKLTIIDFKTDREMNPVDYQEQIRSYVLAMQEVTGKPVEAAYLWYLHKKKMVKVDYGTGKNG